MAESSEQFTIGAEVSCTDGSCGKLSRVVIDPVARELTHLIIGPEHPPDAARLVPIELVDATAAGLQLRCTVAEFAALNPAEETQFIEGSTEYAAYGTKQEVFWPRYSNRGSYGTEGRPRDPPVDLVPGQRQPDRQQIPGADGVPGDVGEVGRHQEGQHHRVDQAAGEPPQARHQRAVPAVR